MAINMIREISEGDIVHDSLERIVVLNKRRNCATFYQLIDTKAIFPQDNLEEELGRERDKRPTTLIVLEDTGYAKIYRPEMKIVALENIEETIESLVNDLKTA